MVLRVQQLQNVCFSKLNYSSIVRMQIDTGVEMVIFDKTKSRDRMVDFDKIKYINNNPLYV